MSKITVYILDDDVDVRTTLNSVFRFNGFNVHVFAKPQELLNYELKSIDSCMVLDLAMPEMNGIELQRKLREQGVVLPIIIYSGTANIDSAVSAMSQGAYTVLQKPADNKALINAVNLAVSNFKTKQNELEINRLAYAQIAGLTKREYEISLLITEGLTSTAIADQLCISTRTVEAHRAAIFQKLEIKAAGPLAQLVLRADLHANQLHDKNA